ncbi:ATP-binding cassette domain-containing protein, partial [Anaerovibrio slackiae]
MRNINLDIPAGEFVALVGKSGCGKSTLLRLISSLESSTSGDILINGEQTGTIDGNVRVLFQDARLLPWKTVLDNV